MAPAPSLHPMTLHEADKLLREGFVKFEDLFTRDWITWYFRHEVEASKGPDDAP